MKKLQFFAVAVLMLFFLAITVNAAQNDQSNAEDNIVQSGQIIRPKAGLSWHEQVDKQRTFMRRGSERRNAAKRDAMMGKQEKMEDATIDSYNAMIEKKNAKNSKQQ
ncbi:hypothetical protein [Desulfobacterium sp. N47]|uniref:Uncharacterized protein n=1 Tax=uncultured Desulfobacterium sp. TaxID=201089 RepID=E1YIZ0_9BACT|nr:unknown protein [uncultured Desulfobacterium sp.]